MIKYNKYKMKYKILIKKLLYKFKIIASVLIKLVTVKFFKYDKVLKKHD